MPAIEYSKYLDADFVYPKSAEYKCDEGYETEDKSKSFEVSCIPDGDFKPMKRCQAVKRGEVPDLAKSQYHRSAIMFYPDVLPVQCNLGFAADAKKHDETTFDVKCKSNKALDIPYPQGCVPKDCGTLSEVNNGKASGNTYFGSVALAQCDTGFSFDQSTAPEATEEKITCQTDGKYAKLGECKRILCGVAAGVEHTKRPGGKMVYEDIEKYIHIECKID